MYIDDADWLHSLEEASAAPCHHLLCSNYPSDDRNCRVCPPCLTHCGALRRSTTKSKSPPARPLKNVTQRANQLLRAVAFSPCSDAEMRSERTHAGPQFLLDCLFCSSTNRFVLSRFFQVVPLAHCIVDSHVRLFRSRVMHLKPISSRSREDALDEWFLDEPKKKTLKGFAPLMAPEWQLARIARVLAALLPRRGRVMFRCFRALLDHLPAAQEAMVQSEARKMGFECPASAFERTFTLAVARSMPPSGAESGAPEPHLVTYAAMITAYMYIDDADWLHSLEEASAAPCHHLLCELQSMSPVSDSLRCSAQIHNQEQEPTRPTAQECHPTCQPATACCCCERTIVFLLMYNFSPCSDAEMRSERTHAGPQFLLDCLFCSSTNRFVLSRFFPCAPFSLKSDAPEAVMEPLPLPYRLALDALDEWFLDESKKKTLKGFAPLMAPEWQLARIARLCWTTFPLPK
eukprot:gene361-206_t